jgi:glyceraldehyde 3-phosphate dehydrogenase
MIKIAINGFGRIGRAAFRAGWSKPDFDVVAINDLASAEQLAYLLRYDSNYGTWNVPVSFSGNSLIVGGREIPVLAEKDPQALPWGKLGVDVVIESTGFFLTTELAGAHITAGAKSVVLSAPAKSEEIPVYVRGVNCEAIAGDSRRIISNASCTTNCVAPVAAVIEEAFGIEKALLTTVHSYTASQSLVDAPKKDWREGRAAAQNIAPTTTGAAKTVARTIPSLQGIFDGLSIRVPVPTVSLSDMVFVLKRNVTADDIGQVLRAAAASKRFAGILGVSNEPLVSRDFLGDTRSAIVDTVLTTVVGGNLAKIVAWYDNEWGYANRLVEVVLMKGQYSK